jgi:hypothetical protein
MVATPQVAAMASHRLPPARGRRGRLDQVPSRNQSLLKEARARQRFSIFVCVLLFVTLTTVAAGYIFSSGSTAWIGASLTSSSTNLAIVALAYLFSGTPGKSSPSGQGRSEPT